MRSFRLISRTSAALVACAATWAAAGVLDTPLPTFSDAKPAVRVAVIPAAIHNNNLATEAVCTNLAAAAVDIGLEVFDQTGKRGNTIASGNGAVLTVGPGATVTIGTSNTAVFHEDAVITLEAPVTNLRNGSARIIASSSQVGCVAFALDDKHVIADPATCPTCAPPVIVNRALDFPAGGSTTTTHSTTTATSTTTPGSTSTTMSTTTSTSTTLPPLCASTPRIDCLAPPSSKSRLLLKNDLKDILVWKWGLGPATTLADYASPTTATQYALCIYDQVGGVTTLVSEAGVPPGGICGTKPCWTSLPNGLGFKYRNVAGDPQGLTKITLRVGIAGKPKIGIKGKGSLLPLPALPLHPPTVAVQLVHGPGVCWGATYSAAFSNTATLFKAASD